MNQPITSLNLPINIINKLQNNGYYYCDDVKTDFETISAKINLPNWPSLTKAPKPKTALELLEDETTWQTVTTFIPELDSVLTEKIMPGTVTELTGYPGSGKTQVCLHLLAGVEGEAVFIHTNKNFNPLRLREICQKHFSGVETVLERIYCIEATDSVELFASIRLLESWLVESRRKVRLLLIDSFTWPLKQYFAERTSFIYSIFENIRVLANSHKFAVVVTNDMTTRISEGTPYHTPSFGGSFYHIINNRILLEKDGDLFNAKILKSVVGEPQTSPAFHF